MWAGLRVEISCFSTTSTDALNMVGTAVQPVIAVDHNRLALFTRKSAVKASLVLTVLSFMPLIVHHLSK